ncbi:MAG: SprT family zinc-dependent metalloprotease [Bacteroidota bacterium]
MAVQKIYLDINGRQVPAKIYRELRRNVRASIGKNAAILRMPSRLGRQQEQEQFIWFQKWVKQQLEKHEHLETRFFGRQYKSGDTIQVGARSYRLLIEYCDRKTHSAILRNGIVHLRLSREDSGAHLQKNIRHLLSRSIAQDFLPAISRRVQELNALYFKKDIRSVNLKYNQSNWGSCSSRSNINLSTRLLFAPDEVIDYVIIHELAHLEEMNHSSRFWKLVAEAMPDYKQKERWLKVNGPKCNF